LQLVFEQEDVLPRPSTVNAIALFALF